MLGCYNQAWVTSALFDEDVQQALTLSFSLKRVFTTRKIAVLASTRISPKFRKLLSHGFDVVCYLDEDDNTAGLKIADFAKIYSIMASHAFDRCVYLVPNMIAMRNCDDIFSEETGELQFLEDPSDISIFAFRPSVDLFESLMKGLGSLNEKNDEAIFGRYLNEWVENNLKCSSTISGKYNKLMKNDSTLLGNEDDISLVNLPDSPEILNMDNTEGILKNLIAIYLQKIQNEDVIPLINGSIESSIPSKLGTYLGSRYRKEPIAIVGMSCRYPGSNNLEEFWDLLFKGQDATSNPPPFRWLRDQYPKHVHDRNQTNAGFLKDPIDKFDWKFFGISPKEALFMDPQHRLLHELVWEGLEDACIDPHSLRNTFGAVFAGAWQNEWRDLFSNSGDEFYRRYMGNSIGAAAARISFLLGMTGPSIATESGCSSAMVALHLACRALQNGETNLSLACGVNLLLQPFNKDLMPMVISPDGHCKTFSEDANGYARAEGAGVLVLKRLSDALKDGDHIWGLIRGSAVAQEGLSKSMGTPTVTSESKAMTLALKDAGVPAEEVSYVEAHGTGTVLGDPMEIAAIAEAYHSAERKDPLIVGSVKTNVGHTESCSGITGIMKVILAMHHELIPSHRNFTKLNPAINLNAIPAVITLELMDWKKLDGKPRVAGVSSFGITGTDAHVIVEEPPLIKCSRPLCLENIVERPWHILKLSAKSEEAMAILLKKYKDAVISCDASLADICFSANTGRADFPIRATIVAKSKDEICSAISKQKYLKGEAMGQETIGKICFLFTGQGSQHPKMAKTLYESSPIFKMHFDHCNKILRTEYNINITNVLWSSDPTLINEINKTIYSQTSIFCVEYALLKLWESWGVKPDYVLGHSLGEHAASVCAGIMTLGAALKLVTERGRLIEDLPPGRMLVIKADEQQVDQLMGQFACGNKKKLLDYAAINSKEQTVVAGDSDVVLQFSEFCKARNVKCTVLDASHAFHSKHMDPILDEYRKAAETVEKLKGWETCGYISGMTGDLISNSDNINADYWVQHTRDRVRFLKASQKAVELGCRIFIEIGPQPVLCALTMMSNDTNLLCLPSLKRNEEEWRTMLTTLGQLYVKGIKINWRGLDQFQDRRKIRLPHYPFIGKKIWPDMVHFNKNAKINDVETTSKSLEVVLEQQTNPLPPLWEEIWLPKIGPAQYSYNLERKEILTISTLSKVKTWLLFHKQDSPISNFLLQKISLLTNRRVILVKDALKYEKLVEATTTEYTVKRDSEADFLKVLKDIENCEHMSLEGVVYCWSLEKETDQEKILKPFFYLAKAILKLRKGSGLKFIALVKGVAPVNDKLNSSGFHMSTILGFMKSLQSERTDLCCRYVDIGNILSSETDMMTIFYEIWSNGKDLQVAYHDNARYTPKLVQLKETLGYSTKTYTPMFTSRGTYLITGGLGGIGLEVCKWMLKMGAKYILLAGRNPPNSKIQEVICELNEKYCSKVQSVQLDVAIFDQCKELIFSKIPEMGYPILKGVMHAAGTLHDSLIENQTWESLSSTFGAKVNGTLNLHELTKDNSKLEHFVLFSSVVALLGSPGQSNHAAGNQFEDTFAHYRNALGLPATFINWGQWGEVGIATENQVAGLKPLSNLQAISGLEYVLKSQRIQTGVIKFDLLSLKKLFPHLLGSYLDGSISEIDASEPIHLQQPNKFWQTLANIENVEKKENIIKKELHQIVRTILNLEESDNIEDTANLENMGVDSLMCIEIRNSVQALLGDKVTLFASELRNCNSIQHLSEAIIRLSEGNKVEDKVNPSE